MSTDGRELADLEVALRELGQQHRWAWPERASAAEPAAGAVPEATLALCRRVAKALQQAAQQPSQATAALQLARTCLGCEMTVARRFDEILSVEAGCILSEGRAAAQDAMAAVSSMIQGFLQLEAALAEHLSNEPSTTAVELSFNARSLGTLLLPTLLECTLAGVTKCWDSDWSVLGKQVQPLHDLILQKPVLDHAALALLQLIWLRAPMLLPASDAQTSDDKLSLKRMAQRSPPLPQCIYGLACLSQEIHDRLVAEGLEEANAEEILLMAHVRREVLKQLGQGDRWQPEGSEERPKPSRKPRSSKTLKAAPKPSAKKRGRPKLEVTPLEQQVAPVEQQDIQSFMEALVEKFGCEPLVGSFMERVEKAMAAMALAAGKGFAKEADEASDAVLAAEKLGDLMTNFQILLSFGAEAQRAIVAQLPSLVGHLLDTSSWPDCWRHALCDMLELVIHQELAREASASLWDQVGQKWLENASASRLTAVGSLATVLAGVLAEMPDTKAAEGLKCMQNLRYSAASCLICFQEADPHKTLDGELGKVAFSYLSSAEEDAPRPSRPRCSDEMSDSSEEIGSEDTPSHASDSEAVSDLESFEDDAEEFNDCGFLLAGSPQKRARFTSSDGASRSDQPATSSRHRSNLVPDWKERVKEILKKMPPASSETSNKTGDKVDKEMLRGDDLVKPDSELQLEPTEGITA